MWSARKSVALPFPSSPHWDPTRIVAGIAGILVCEVWAAVEAPVVGRIDCRCHDLGASMIDLAQAYLETHDHLAELVRGLPEDMLARTVQATPAWDVRDAVAHVTGEARIALSGDAPPDLN